MIGTFLAVLKVLLPDGTLYQSTSIPDGGYIIRNTEKLYYEETDINTCKTLTLPPGNYRIEIKGGKGGGNAAFGTGYTYQGEIKNHSFKADTETTIQIFRGGDGTAICTPGRIPSAGSSGVDSLLLINDTTVRAIGGHGVPCTNRTYITEIQKNWIFTQSIGGGGGAIENIYNYYNEDLNRGMPTLVTHNYDGMVAGGGGGGAPDGTPKGSSASINPSKFERCMSDGANCIGHATIGTAATKDQGGNGGDAYASYYNQSLTAVGGQGGKTTTWPCGTTHAYSYGGGGSGAICGGGFMPGGPSNLSCTDGDDGGSGSTGTSDTSYIRIFAY